MSRNELSARTGGEISAIQILSYENGARSFTVLTLHVIAEALGVDAGSLLNIAELNTQGMQLKFYALDIPSLKKSGNSRLQAVVRWFTPLQATSSRKNKMIFGDADMLALATFVGVTLEELLELLRAENIII